MNSALYGRNFDTHIAIWVTLKLSGWALKSPESFGNLEIWPDILGDSAGDSIG